jgi:putative SOS response-associated peptidase YedK
MPVILDSADYDAWLTPTDTSIPQALLPPFPAQLMEAFPISTGQQREERYVGRDRTASVRSAIEVKSFLMTRRPTHASC